MIITEDKKTGEPSKIISEIFQDIDATLSLKLSAIETDERTYIFSYPVLFQISQEGDGTIIENEQLDIYASGLTVPASKKDLSDQFDHTYRRLNELNDSLLSKRFILIKEYYHFVIKEIIDK